VFFLDNGIRNQLLNRYEQPLETRPDKGQLFENWAFSEISKALPFQSDLKFWRSKAFAEIDFIIEHAGNLYALEVKAGEMKRPLIGKPVHSFLEAYAPERMAIFNVEKGSAPVFCKKGR